MFLKVARFTLAYKERCKKLIPNRCTWNGQDSSSSGHCPGAGDEGSVLSNGRSRSVFCRGQEDRSANGKLSESHR